MPISEATLAKSTRSSGKKAPSPARVPTAMASGSAARHAALPLSTLMLAASVSSWAQTPAQPEEKTLGTVTIKEAAEAPQGKDALQTRQTNIGKGTQDIRDIPQSINVVTEKLIDDRKVDTLNEALRMTAGVTFSAAENGTMQDTFIRGFSVAQVGDLLIDGMKDPSLYERETFNLDRIEVMRGSASMIFGRGSTGGVVNQVNKKPMLIDQHDVDFTVGSRGYLRATGDFNLRTGEDSALRLNVMSTQARNNGASVDRQGLAPSYSFGIGTKNEFTVGLYYLDYDNTPRNGLPYATIGSIIRPQDFYGTASDFSRGEAKYGYLQHIHRFDDGGELRSQFRAGNFKRSMWGTQTRITGTASTITGSTVVTRSGLTPRKDAYDGAYLQSDYSNKFDWFGVKHELLTGIDAAHEKADRFTQSVAGGNKGTTTVGNPNDGFRPVEPVFGSAATGGYESNSIGAYVQDLVQVAPHWKLLGGLRVDSISGDFRSTTTQGGVVTYNKAWMSDTVGSYRAGVLYQPTPTSSFHLSYGTSFNTSADTYQYVTQQTANTPPEKSRNLELGAKIDWLEGKLSTRAAIFRTEKFNERTTDADYAGDAYLLSGKRHSAGLELEVVGRPTPDMEVYLSYAFIPTTRIDRAGSTAQSSVGQKFGLVPKHSGSAWVTYNVTPQLRLGAGLTGSSENYSISGTSPVRGARAPGYVIADLLAEYRFTPETYLQFNVSNVNNTLYAAELYRGFYVAGAPRTYKLTIGTRF